MHSGDKVTKVEYRRKPGFFERLGKSCSGILIGICMLFCSFVILYNNEVSIYKLRVELLIIIKLIYVANYGVHYVDNVLLFVNISTSSLDAIVKIPYI